MADPDTPTEWRGCRDRAWGSRPLLPGVRPARDGRARLIDGEEDRHALAVATAQEPGIGARCGGDDAAAIAVQGQRSLDARVRTRHRETQRAGLLLGPVRAAQPDMG